MIGITRWNSSYQTGHAKLLIHILHINANHHMFSSHIAHMFAYTFTVLFINSCDCFIKCSLQFNNCIYKSHCYKNKYNWKLKSETKIQEMSGGDFIIK